MKIFHIVSNKEWGGGEQYVYDLSQRQRTEGIDVTIFCKPVEAIMQKYQEAGMTVIPLALGGALDIRSAWKMAKVIETHSNIHAHNFKDAFTACYAKCLARNKQVRVVMCRHLTRKGKNTLLYRWLYLHLDRLIFDSELSRSVFLSTRPTIDEAKLGIVHTSIVVPETFEKTDLRMEFQMPSDCVIGMFHGRLDPEKGLDTLMEAVAQIKDKPFRLVLVGRGSEDYTAHLHQMAEDKGISDKVIFAGFRHPVLSVVAAADFGILASTVQEGCPLSPQEYMSQGHPVVVTNNGGQREYVFQDHNGLLVPPGDAKALAEAIARLVDDAALRQRLGMQAKADFDDHLNYDHYYEQIKKIYEE
ncbi:MAG: glycosyltransferase family 4 protein [Prevotella sp.]|nr:glycosyltransferase family 4 protein [Prevotella sp.]